MTHQDMNTEHLQQCADAGYEAAQVLMSDGESLAFAKAAPSQQTPSGGSDHRLVVPLPCPFCGAEPGRWVADPGAPYPGGYFEICCENEDCAVGPCLSEKRRTDLVGMTHTEAEASIWPELIAKWNLRHNVKDHSPIGAVGASKTESNSAAPIG